MKNTRLSFSIFKPISGLVLLVMMAAFQSHAQKIYVPDDVFERYLIATTGDNVMDDSIPVLYALTVGSIRIENDSLKDLTGIQGFTNLTQLNVNNNKLTQLDLSKNLKLTMLSCYLNKLTSLLLPPGLELKKVDAMRNELTSINVAFNPNLTYLDLYKNKLSSLDVTQNPLLDNLICDSNSISVLDVSQNPALLTLSFSHNNVENINLENLKELRNLYCTDNKLKSLDVTNSLKLQDLYAYNNLISGAVDIRLNGTLRIVHLNNNQIDSVAVANSSTLTKLIVSNNKLRNLDLRGQATLLSSGTMHASMNPLLPCILVDNPTTAAAKGKWLKDPTTQYGTTGCGATSISEEDDVVKKTMIVSPSHSSGIFTMYLPSSTRISVMDTQGNLVYAQSHDSGIQQLDLSFCQSGLYVLRAENTNATSAHRLVVSK